MISLNDCRFLLLFQTATMATSLSSELVFDGRRRDLPVSLFLKILDRSVMKEKLGGGDAFKLYMNSLAEDIALVVKEDSSIQDVQTMKTFLQQTFQKDLDLIDCLHMMKMLQKNEDEHIEHYILRVQFVVETIQALSQTTSNVLSRLLFLQGLPIALSVIEDQLSELIEDLEQVSKLDESWNVEPQKLELSIDCLSEGPLTKAAHKSVDEEDTPVSELKAKRKRTIVRQRKREKPPIQPVKLRPLLPKPVLVDPGVKVEDLASNDPIDKDDLPDERTANFEGYEDAEPTSTNEDVGETFNNEGKEDVLEHIEVKAEPFDPMMGPEPVEHVQKLSFKNNGDPEDGNVRKKRKRGKKKKEVKIEDDEDLMIKVKEEDDFEDGETTSKRAKKRKPITHMIQLDNVKDINW